MPSYVEVATGQLASLCRALDVDEGTTRRWLNLQEFLFQPWGRQQVPMRPVFPSHVTDDHSPYEYSLASSEAAWELRILIEAQSGDPSLVTTQNAGVDLICRVAERFRLDLTPLELVASEFFPERPAPPFTAWLRATLPPSGAPEFRLYLNPQVRGRDQAREVVRAALGALDLGDVHRILDREVLTRDDRDELTVFALDLSGRPDARVTVRVSHEHAGVPELERLLALSPTYRAGDVSDYFFTLLERSGPLGRKAPSTCYSFVPGVPGPTSVSLLAPVGQYVSEPQLVVRAGRYLERQGIGSRQYLRAFAAMSNARVWSSTPVQSCLSFRRDASGVRTTASFCPCLFGDVDLFGAFG